MIEFSSEKWRDMTDEERAAFDQARHIVDPADHLQRELDTHRIYAKTGGGQLDFTEMTEPMDRWSSVFVHRDASVVAAYPDVDLHYREAVEALAKLFLANDKYDRAKDDARTRIGQMIIASNNLANTDNLTTEDLGE